MGYDGVRHVVAVASVRCLYISSVLQFVAQLEPLPAHFAVVERSAVQALLPEPRGWVPPSGLKDAAHFHFPVALVDLAATSVAAKVRVVHHDNAVHGGLLVRSRAARLLWNFPDDVTIGHIAWCQSWGGGSFFHHLAKADNIFTSRLRAGQAVGVVLNRRGNFQKQITPLFRTTDIGSSTSHFPAGWTV